MSRGDGFAVMDISTAILSDEKFKRLARQCPERVTTCVVAYIAVCSQSWRTGRRQAIEDAWPLSLAPFDADAVDAMTVVGLLDRRGQIPVKTWREWFTRAQERRDKSRERWRRYNATREARAAETSTNDDVVTTRSPRGANAATASSVTDSDSVTVNESTREIPPPPTEWGRRANGTNPRANGSSPRKRSTNPRATGTSTRQVRADQKRGSTQLADVLRRAIGTTSDVDVDEDLEDLALPDQVGARP